MCTVLVNGEPRRACILPVGDVAGSTIETIEGLSSAPDFEPLASAFIRSRAFQCGYCTPGMVTASLALLRREPHPGPAAIIEALDGHLCRCGTYQRIVEAVGRAGAAAERGGTEAPAGDTPPDRALEGHPPGRPWDRLAAEDRDYFDVLGGGLVVVLGPPPTGSGGWSTVGGAWIHIGGDGAVTAFTGKVEVGQDTRTALGLLVADELSVPAGSVRLVMGDTDLCPYDAGTFGSRSMPDAAPALRIAAASAREQLKEMAAELWGLSGAPVITRDGKIIEPLPSRGGREITYAQVVAGRRRLATGSWDAPLIPARGWRAADHPSPNARARGIVTGTKRYVTDLTRPGALVGKVLRAPAFGARLTSADLTAAEAVPGVTTLRDGDFIGLAAPDAATAERALAAIRAEWEAPPGPSHQGLADWLRRHRSVGEGGIGGYADSAGDVDAALAGAPVRVEATYTAPYIAHVPIETRAALAEWSGDRLTVWVGTQRPFPIRRALAEAIGIDEDQVRVVVPDTGTGFGGKHSPEVALEAALLARAAGRPVKVRWKSTEEFTSAYVRPAAVIDVRAGADCAGRIVAWDFTDINAGAFGMALPYDVPNWSIAYRPAESPLWQGSYRALAATVNHFAKESHIDELAHRLGADPLEFRLRHIADERLAAVLEEAARKLGWQPGAAVGTGTGMGLACGLEKEGRVATGAAAEVGIGGRLRILRIVTAFETGVAVHPDNLRNQVEGATVMGLGGALWEAIELDGGRIANGSLTRYRVPRFSDIPPIEVALIDRPDLPPTGGGEAPIITIAPALANAIYQATGTRLRSMPLVPEGVVRPS